MGRKRRAPRVQREWLLRCVDRRASTGVCVIGVSNGVVEIAGPEDDTFFTLELEQIADFRTAFEAAVRRAEEDLG